MPVDAGAANGRGAAATGCAVRCRPWASFTDFPADVGVLRADTNAALTADIPGARVDDDVDRRGVGCRCAA